MRTSSTIGSRSAGTFLAVLLGFSCLVWMFGPAAAADVSPSTVDLVLEPGQSESITKEAVITDLPPVVDLCLVVDRSASFERDLDALRQNLSTITGLAQGRDMAFGLAGFVDHPVAPFGFPDDVAYSLLASVGSAADFEAAVADLRLGRGGDPAEAQLDAIVAAAGSDTDGCGWRTGTDSRLLVATTDSLCHAPDGVHIASVDDAIAAMNAAEITFIGLVESPEAEVCFGPLAVGTNGSTTPLASDASAIAAAITDAIGSVEFDITPTPDVDCPVLTVSFEPPTRSGVTLGETVEFVETVELPADFAGPRGVVIECEVDFGAAGSQTIRVTPAEEPTPTPTATATPTPTVTPEAKPKPGEIIPGSVFTIENVRTGEFLVEEKGHIRLRKDPGVTGSWRFEETAKGEFRIVNTDSGAYLDGDGRRREVDTARGWYRGTSWIPTFREGVWTIKNSSWWGWLDADRDHRVRLHNDIHTDAQWILDPVDAALVPPTPTATPTPTPVASAGPGDLPKAGDVIAIENVWSGSFLVQMDNQEILLGSDGDDRSLWRVEESATRRLQFVNMATGDLLQASGYRSPVSVASGPQPGTDWWTMAHEDGWLLVNLSWWRFLDADFDDRARLHGDTQADAQWRFDLRSEGGAK